MLVFLVCLPTNSGPTVTRIMNIYNDISDTCINEVEVCKTMNRNV